MIFVHCNGSYLHCKRRRDRAFGDEHIISTCAVLVLHFPCGTRRIFVYCEMGKGWTLGFRQFPGFLSSVSCSFPIPPDLLHVGA